jgi:hypothetical protein
MAQASQAPGVVFAPGTEKSVGQELGSLFQTLGTSLPQIFNPEGLKQQQVLEAVRSDPALGRALAQGVRASNPEQMANLMGLQNTPEAIAFFSGVESANPITIEEQVSGILTGDPMAAAEIGRGIVAEATAGAETAVAETQAQQNRLALEQARDRFNLPRREAFVEGETFDLQTEQIRLAKEAIPQYEEFVKKDPFLANLAASFMTNPQFADALVRFQEMEARIAASTRTDNMAEMLAKVMVVNGQAIDQRAAVVEAFDLADDETTRLSAINDYNRTQLLSEIALRATGTPEQFIVPTDYAYLDGKDMKFITFEPDVKRKVLEAVAGNAAEADAGLRTYAEAVDRLAKDIQATGSPDQSIGNFMNPLIPHPPGHEEIMAFIRGTDLAQSLFRDAVKRTGVQPRQEEPGQLFPSELKPEERAELRREGAVTFTGPTPFQ